MKRNTLGRQYLANLVSSNNAYVEKNIKRLIVELDGVRNKYTSYGEDNDA